MAKIVLHYLDGKTRTYTGGASVYRGFVYIWRPGVRKGRKPIAKVPLRSLHSLKRTGRKGIVISKY